MLAPLRVLVLCTGNSARSQIAEALLNRLGAGRIEASSAGSRPAARVNPGAIDVLRRHGIDWKGHAPRGLDGLEAELLQGQPARFGYERRFYLPPIPTLVLRVEF
jgi:arsenate reductase